MGTDLGQDSIATSEKWQNWAIITETPQHQVNLASYQISRYPVTNLQWEYFLRASAYCWLDRDKLWKSGIPAGKAQHPVVWVTWYDALAFCQWAGVSLPSDAQWERAARGIDKRLYPWGNELPASIHANFGKQIGDTTAVDHYPQGQSPDGVYDMAGNTWEWISTLWGTDKNNPRFVHPYRANDGREDLFDRKQLRMVRGGGWKYSSDLIRAAYRDWNKPSIRGNGLGFRVVSI